MKAIIPYLKHMAEKEGSDMYFTTGALPSVKIDGKMTALSKTRLAPGSVKKIAYEVMNEDQQMTFELSLSINFAVSLENVGRFRFNVFQQKGDVSIVIRYIKSNIPDFKTLGLPKVLGSLMKEKKGLILIVGSTGSGKSTTMASMIDYRNKTEKGHILTVEDPMEYVFEHKLSIINQREIGLDAHTYDDALVEALREAPDVIMIGEIRDRLAMQSCIAFSDTGHLCLSTLHAVNAHQALDRIINMFPAEAKNQILMDLSLNLKAIISQRLVDAKKGKRVAAVEVMINSPYISKLILKGRVHEIKDAMTKSGEAGMITFDQSLFSLFKSGKIELNTALDNADSRSDLEWKMNFGGGSSDLNAVSSKNDETLEFPVGVDDL